MEPDRFEEALSKGIEAEDYVYEWLKQTYAFVQDTRYQTRDKNKGPRLDGMSGSVILPDFIIYDRFAGKVAIDVKFKSSIYPINGKKCFTVDEYKFNDYIRCVELMGLDNLWIIFRFDGSIYLYEAKETIGIHTFENNYGKKAYLFEYSEKKVRR